MISRFILSANNRMHALMHSPVLCLESALMANGVGTYNLEYPQVFADVSHPLDFGVGEYIPNKFGDKDIVVINNRRTTTPYRALCEMIIYDRREELILEGLDDLLYECNIDKQIILDKAKEYGVLEQMERLLVLVDDRDYW